MPSAAVLQDRLARLAGAAARTGQDAVVVGPGADMTYLLGHHVVSHERLTCLVVPVDEPPLLVVPILERPGWAGSTAEQLDLDFHLWHDGEDPYRLVADLLPASARVLAVDNHLPAMHVLSLRAAVPGSEVTLAAAALTDMRMRKNAAEIAALTAVGQAIDRVHRRMGEWLRAGRTEREVARDIAEAIVAEGHLRADFVIVGSGRNGASPHHEASDRVIEPGDGVVVDIGGPAPSGYNSDCTRTYVVGGAEPDPEFVVVHEVVRRAQAAAVASAVAGATAESVDEAARSVIVRAGYGEHFITRTGHGIGLEVHEHPYIVSGNSQILEPGMAFSVEPGIYLPGRFGVRIEDIVIVGDDGPILCNTAPTELVAMN